MESRNQQVVHKRFGRGAIQSIEGNVIRVYFQDYGARAFRYPEAFEGFLRAEDAEFADQVENDLNRWREEKGVQAAEMQLKLAAEAVQAKAARKRPAAKKPAGKTARAAGRQR